MKKLFFFLFFLFQTTLCFWHIETERTIWLPWTIEHTQEWEKIEQQDTAQSQFRRNEFFENSDQLIIRDKNWLKLRDYLDSFYKKPVIFPDLGFAIIRKTDHALIGTIRMKLHNQTGCMSFGYGLRPEVRNGKFGQETIKAFTALIEQLIGSDIVTFNNDTDKNTFMAEWYKEGVQENPNFDHLISFFNPTPCTFQKIICSVDITNQASLAVLMRNDMQPFGIECEKYIFARNDNLFSFDFLLQYPSHQSTTQSKIKNLVADVLSRNQARIDQAHNDLKELFNVPSNAKYAQLTRAEKQALKPLYTIESSTLFYHSSRTKKITSHIYYPPYCLIR